MRSWGGHHGLQSIEAALDIQGKLRITGFHSRRKYRAPSNINEHLGPFPTRASIHACFAAATLPAAALAAQLLRDRERAIDVCNEGRAVALDARIKKRRPPGAVPATVPMPSAASRTASALGYVCARRASNDLVVSCCPRKVIRSSHRQLADSRRIAPSLNRNVKTSLRDVHIVSIFSAPPRVDHAGRLTARM